MQRIHKLAVITGMTLVLVGCKGGGGAFGFLGDPTGFSSFFGGGPGSSLDDGLDQLASLDLEGSEDGQPGGGPGDLGDETQGPGDTTQGPESDGGSQGSHDDGPLCDYPSAGTIHEPEPASFALFASGFGLALLRRRTQKRV